MTSSNSKYLPEAPPLDIINMKTGSNFATHEILRDAFKHSSPKCGIGVEHSRYLRGLKVVGDYSRGGGTSRTQKLKLT